MLHLGLDLEPATGELRRDSLPVDARQGAKTCSQACRKRLSQAKRDIVPDSLSHLLSAK